MSELTVTCYRRKRQLIPRGKSCRPERMAVMQHQNLDRGILETPAHRKLLIKLFMHTARRPCISMRSSRKNTGGFGYHSRAPCDVSLHLDACSSFLWTSELLPIAANGCTGLVWFPGSTMPMQTPQVDRSIDFCSFRSI